MGRPTRVVTIGDWYHGKTTLTAAIAKVLHDRSADSTQLYAFDQIDNAPESQLFDGFTMRVSRVAYQTANRHYEHVDAPSHADYVKYMITAGTIDGAILVVAATDSVMPQTREHLLLARQVGVPAVVVALNKSDLVDDEELLELVELEVRELLAVHEFDEYAPVIRVSALKALEGDTGWVKTVEDLIVTIDEMIPETIRLEIDKPFLMPVENVFTITGRGTIVTGRIERGVIHVDDEVEIVGIRPDPTPTTVASVEMFRRLLDQGQAGDNVGLLLRDVKGEDVERGQVIAKPSSATAHTDFEGSVYILTQEDGGRPTAFTDGCHLQFYFRTTDMSGVVTLTERKFPEAPSAFYRPNVMVKLRQRVAMEEGLAFVIRRGHSTIGVGRVTKIIC